MTTTVTTLLKAATTLVAAGTSNAAGATTRARIQLLTGYGGILTTRMTNGPTGPTTQCVVNVLMAHNATQPAAGSAGTDWKLMNSLGNGTAANTDWFVPPFSIDAGVMQLEVEFTGNTGQAVVIEAYYSEITGQSTT